MVFKLVHSDPFLVSVPILYPLKHQEIKSLLVFPGGIKRNNDEKWLNKIYNTKMMTSLDNFYFSMLLQEAGWRKG